MGWGKNTKAQREELQEYDRELYAELKDFYADKYESVNNGER
jgi:hypothetical protein